MLPPAGGARRGQPRGMQHDLRTGVYPGWMDGQSSGGMPGAAL
nr:MAG TPA: Gastrin/cholecystokinin family [Caudoviricetes sp.]